MRGIIIAALALCLMLVMNGCPAGDTGQGGSNADGTTTAGGGTDNPCNAGGGAELSGAVQVDGSSTVYPVTEAVAEEFMVENPGVRVTVGFSGTGGGFKKFGAGETDITGASRPIKDKEIDVCSAAGVDFIELPVAYDGLSVVISKQNDFVDYLSVDELNRIWAPESTVDNWQDVRDSFPDMELKLFGPGTDSGTFDYFTEAINGEGGASRPDYTASEDDNVLVQGVAGDAGALGYFGFAYYQENDDKLRAVPIKDRDGDPVLPSKESIEGGSYTPLSRPVYIYVSTASLEARPEVTAFVEYYLTNASLLAPDVGYVGLPAEAYDAAMANVSNNVTGTAYHTVDKGASVVEALKANR